MFSSPTAIRVLKKQDPAYMRSTTCPSLKYLFLAGEPLDEPTARWVADALGVAIVDNYWQTETGWPILSAQPGVEDTPRKFGSPSFPVYGYDVRLLREGTGDEAAADEKGRAGDRAAAAARLHDDRVGRRRALREDVLSRRSASKLAYSTFDWATRDADGYYFVLGRTDDVINVAGHRLGTREIEEAVQAHAGIAEVAVVGVADPLKGQVPVAFAVVKDAAKRRDRRGRGADAQGGDGHRRPRSSARSRVPAPCTSSRCCRRRAPASCLRRSIQALAEGRDPGDLTTIEDPGGARADAGGARGALRPQLRRPMRLRLAHRSRNAR